MKKLVVAVVALAGVTAFGAIDVAFSNIVGVVRVMSTNKYTLVSVPFGAVGLNLADANETISNLVQTLNFNMNDKVQVYSDEGNVMFSWSLNKKGVWAPMKSNWVNSLGMETNSAPEAANAARIGRGCALRIYRRDPIYSDGSPKPFYLIGQYDSLHGERKLARGSQLKPRRSLVSFPGIGTFDINSIQEGVNAHDTLMVEAGNSFTTYSPSIDDKGHVSWGYNKETVVTKKIGSKTITMKSFVRVTDDTILPCGIGFWYVSAGGEPIIRW